MLRELGCLVGGFVAGYVVGAHATFIAASDAQKDRYMHESGDHY